MQKLLSESIPFIHPEEFQKHENPFRIGRKGQIPLSFSGKFNHVFYLFFIFCYLAMG